MKLVCSVTTIVVAMTICAPIVKGQACWVNSLKPKGESAPTITLATNGKAQYSVIVPAQPTSQEQKAAEDLAKWLKEISGGEFIVVRENMQSVAGTKVINIGNTLLAAAANLAKVDLGDEGYRIDVRDESIFLRGGATRGIINAVYAFLEEDLGCRWYAVGADIIPRNPTLAVSAVPRTSKPAFIDRRDVFYSEAQDSVWSLRNRTLGIGSNNPPLAYGGYPKPLSTTGFVHSFNSILSREEFFASHPEYFMLDGNGQRSNLQWCLTNPDVLRIALKRIRAGLAAEPDARIVDVSPNDGGGICQCKNCRAINAREASGSGTLIRFVNAVADALKKQYPNVRVSTLAYLDTISPPKYIRPRDNVLIWLCADSHAWEHLLLFVWETEKFNKALKAWNAIGARMVIWDYPIDYHNYIIPLPNMPVVTENMRYYLQHGATGIFLQAQHNHTYGVDRSVMRSWVWAKQMWDPTRDTKTLVRDFNYGFYGKAAAPMQEYDDLLWQTWERLHSDVANLKKLAKQYGPGVGGAFLTPEFVDRAYGLMQQAERLSKGDEELTARIKLAKLPLLYLLCKRDQIANQDPQAYLKLIDEFESIAHANHVSYIESGLRGPTCEEIIASWRHSVKTP